MEDFQEQITQERPLDLKELIAPYLYRWPLFILMALVASGIAFVYLRYATPVYEVNSLLLIKDDENSGLKTELPNQFDLFGSSKVLDNEIEIIRSKTIMQEVVRRLNLEVSLKTPGRIINVDVYEKRPVIIKAIKINPATFGKRYELSFPSNYNYSLKDLDAGEVFTGEIDKIQNNNLGSFIVAKTPNFQRNQQQNFEVSFLNPNLLAESYLSALTIQPSSPKSSVLKITLKSTLPGRGVDILNTLVEVYNASSLKEKNRTIKNSIDFINERLQLISVELTDVEKDIEGFKSKQGLTDISGDASSFSSSVRATATQLNEINLKLEVIKNIRATLKENFKAQRLPSTLGIEDALLVQQISQLYALELQKTNLLATLPASNPVFKPINDQIAGLKTNISFGLNALETTLRNMRSSMSSYNKHYEELIKKIPGQERKFLSIKRQQSIKENLYLFLLQKKEESVLSAAASVADTRVVETASASLNPISPKRMMIMGGAFVSGLLLCVLYVYSRELLNNRVSSAEELKKLTSISILSEIVQQEDGALIKHNSRSAIAEQLRSLRTNLQFINRKRVEEGGRITLLTSSMSGEGKSFVACNLAVVSALSGKKTILLELDLRKPKISKYLGLKNNIGLTNYLIGKAQIADIVQPITEYPNLHVIGSGPVPPNPSELLIGEEMQQLISNLKANYEEVIIDSPPVGLVTDAQILGQYAEVTLFLVRQNITFKSQIVNINELYAYQKFPKMNIILNGIKKGGSYGYGYGYGNGYYADDVGSNGSKVADFLKDFKNRLH